MILASEEQCSTVFGKGVRALKVTTGIRAGADEEGFAELEDPWRGTLLLQVLLSGTCSPVDLNMEVQQ